MKRILNLTISVCIAAIVLWSSGCSQINSIIKAFEDNGYTLSKELRSINTSLYAHAIDDVALDELDVGVQVHAFKKLNTDDCAIVLEFDCSKQKMQEYMNNERVRSAFTNVDEQAIKGSCVFLSGGQDARKIFINA